MGKLYFLFMFLCISLLYGNDRLHPPFFEDYTNGLIWESRDADSRMSDGPADRVPETFIDCCRAGMIEVEDGKIHVQSNRFAVIQSQIMFFSADIAWIPVSESMREILGIATIEDYREECRVMHQCLRQHVGFFWSPKWRLWFCLNECVYNFHKNFPNGKGE